MGVSCTIHDERRMRKASIALPLRGTGASRPRRRAGRRGAPARQPISSSRGWSCDRAGRAAPASGASAPSGLRRQVPLPEHGASTSTRSALPRQSASSVSSCGGLRSGFDRAPRRAWPAAPSFDSRAAVGVGGKDRPPSAAAAASASVLPPAPAHRSRTAFAVCGSQASAISWLPSSCTSTRPGR